MTDSAVVIIGAGPAGLTAAHACVQNGIHPVVLEQSDRVGGISRTETYKDFYFDIGGHRFFSKFDEINALWLEMLGKDLLKVSRLSRIYYRDRFFHYPLNIGNALLNLGIAESLMIGASYIKARLFPHETVETFEQWVSNRFGERLYRIFFKSYTEKVWGIPCQEILAEWAAQRIQGLSLLKALANAFMRNHSAKTLIEEFYYPVYGPGMMWEAFKNHVEGKNGQVHLNSKVIGLRHGKGKVSEVLYESEGKTVSVRSSHVISGLPIPCLINLLDPKPPDSVLEAAAGLYYRAFIIVVLILDEAHLFPDQWIYIHSPDVNVGRIQNFKNWSPAMIPDKKKTSIGMEYFCNAGDETWQMPDVRLAWTAAKELSRLGLARMDAVTDSHVVRQPFAYPVYDRKYIKNLGILRNYLTEFDNLQTVGRSGMHRYNNMDHSMMTGIFAVKNILGENLDLWAINDDDAYLEDGRHAETPIPGELIASTFAKLHKTAFATATGCVCGLMVWIATLWLVIKGGDAVGPNLQLLSQYFFGYTVSMKGAFWGMFNGFAWGFFFGWLLAVFRNAISAVCLFRVERKTQMLSFRRFFDRL